MQIVSLVYTPNQVQVKTGTSNFKGVQNAYIFFGDQEREENKPAANEVISFLRVCRISKMLYRFFWPP